MSQLIGLDIYRTERMSYSGNEYTIRFCVRKNKEEYSLFVSNNTLGKEAIYKFHQEVANSYKEYLGEQLESEIFKIIESDIQDGII